MLEVKDAIFVGPYRHRTCDRVQVVVDVAVSWIDASYERRQPEPSAEPRGFALAVSVCEKGHVVNVMW